MVPGSDTIPGSTADGSSKHQSCGPVSRGISLHLCYPRQCGLKLIANPTNALCWLADAPILETFIHAVSYSRVESLPFPTGGYFVVEPQGLFYLNPGPLLALTLFHAKSFLSGMPVD